MAKSNNFGRLDSGSSQNNPAAIIFVHGFTGDWKKTWGRIPEFLAPKLQGWDLFGFGYESRRRFDLLGLWSADAALPEIATKLYSTILTEVPQEKYKAIALVAHSMGGLVVQEAVTKHPGLRDRTTHIILFGTPSAGLAKADKLAFVKQQIENMKPDSVFIRTLRARWAEQHLDKDPKPRFLTIAGELDQFVPPSSSLEPFAESTRRVVPGNHVTMLDVDSQDDPSVKILIDGLTGGAALAGPRNSARVAAEMGKFAQLVERLWPSGTPMPDGLDDKGAVDLAIALEKVGRSSDALNVLLAHKKKGTDVKGVLAGRLKRRWLVTRSEEDYESAKRLYQEAYSQATSSVPQDSDQAYYHGINLAFLELAHEGNYSAATQSARRLAQEVLNHCGQAKDPKYEVWRLATEGDALTILGRWDEGLQKHREAMRKAPEPWQALSIEEQAISTARLVGRSEKEVEALADIYEGQEADAEAVSGVGRGQ
jgi:pimeloyl-ACP methyl ester carboxylesterase